MSFISISDVHVQSPKDPIYQKLLSFLSFAKERKIKNVLLLGDIFDLMVGSHLDYKNTYLEYFKKLEDLANSEICVYFVEGNHDFHLKKIYEDIGVQYLKKEKELNLLGKKFLFSHGDEIQLRNEAYLKYKRSINNPFMDFIANKIIPFKILDRLGTKLSKASRSRNEKRYSGENNDEVKKLFRDSVLELSKSKDFSVYICGHSHVKDEYVSESFTYYNNGYFKLTNSFIYMDEKGEMKFEKL